MRGALMQQLLELLQGRTPLEGHMGSEVLALPAPAGGQALGLSHRGERLGS